MTQSLNECSALSIEHKDKGTKMKKADTKQIKYLLTTYPLLRQP